MENASLMGRKVAEFPNYLFGRKAKSSKNLTLSARVTHKGLNSPDVGKIVSIRKLRRVIR
jgi:hypothetical protein